MEANDIQKLYNQFKGDVLLTKEEETKLLRILHKAPRGEELKFLTDDPIVKQAYHQLITKNMRLVLSRCLRFCSDIKDPRLPTLVSAGTQGLIRSLEKFNVTTGYRLSTYSTWWIDANILDELKRIKTTYALYPTLENQYIAAYRKIRREELRTPTQPEIFEALGWDDSKKIKYLTDRERIYINIQDLTVDGTQWVDPNLVTPDTVIQDVTADSRQELIDSIRHHVEMLPHDQREVISSLWGIDRPKKTLRALVKRTGLTRKAINTLKTEALRTLYTQLTVNNKGPQLFEDPFQ